MEGGRQSIRLADRCRKELQRYENSGPHPISVAADWYTKYVDFTGLQSTIESRTGSGLGSRGSRLEEEFIGKSGS